MSDDDCERTAIILLNWNGRDDLLRCIESLQTHEPRARVCIVDNGSSDGSVDAVRRRFPTCHLIETGENLGFSGGNNVGLRWASSQGFEFVGIMNNDTEVPGPFLQPIIQTISEDPANIYASPQIRYRDDPDSVWFGGSEVEPRTGIYVHSPVHTDQRGLHQSPTLTGCALFAHRSLWDRVGLLDERYFLTFEDTEWSLRANRHGCRGIVVSDSTILHAVSATVRRHASVASAYYYTRNGILLLRGVRTDHEVHPSRFARGQIRWAMKNLLRPESKRRWETLGAVLEGVLDGWRGIGGRR